MDQTAKRDGGKPRPTLVPVKAIRAIAAVREKGCQKYGDPENWRKVVCLRCGLESPWVPRSKGKNGVKKVWNAMILEKRMEQTNG